jgi:glycosyltransferase involved in cell wall biosynthesis
VEASAIPRFSIVIPGYNEERFLPRLLDSIDAAREAYGGGPGAIEVILADNASTDSTASVAASRGCRVVSVERRVIAAARNGGARAARGEIVCFMDADARIHSGTFRAIDEALATGRVVGGATGVRPSWISSTATGIARPADDRHAAGSPPQTPPLQTQEEPSRDLLRATLV